MTCRKETGGCGYEFCWLCMGDWKEHGASTGGYYKCNKYEGAQKNDASLRKMEKKQNDAKHELRRYMHYFERWHNHNKARKFASKMQEGIQSNREKLHQRCGRGVSETQFMFSSCENIVDNRRVLEATYMYGYYLSDSDPTRELFEHMQEMLEKFNEELHGLVELDFPLKEFITSDANGEKFRTHRSRIINLMASCKRFKAELLDGIEVGLRNSAYFNSASGASPSSLVPSAAGRK